jgi:ethanolamine permease
VLYILSMVSLFLLRRREPALIRPYRAPFYPVFPLIALLLGGVCFLAVLASAPKLAFYAFLVMLAGQGYYYFYARKKLHAENP